MKDFWLAFSFLTIIPVKKPEAYSPADLGRAAVWFPFVGLVIGSVLVLMQRFVFAGFQGAVPAALLLLLWVLMSGGLHLDGLIDCFDGLLVSASKERRLEILKDSHVGAFAVIGAGMYFVLKFAALEALTGWGALILAPVLGRWIQVLGALLPVARPGGLGDMFKTGITRRGLFLAGLLTVVTSAVFGCQGLIAFCLAHLVGAGFYLFAHRRIGGMTGDVLGAVCEISEVAVLLAFTWRVF